MEVNLSPELKAYVDQRVAAGAFSNTDEALDEALALLKAQEDADNESIRRGIEDAEAGRTQPLDEAMAELTARFKT